MSLQHCIIDLIIMSCNVNAELLKNPMYIIHYNASSFYIIMQKSLIFHKFCHIFNLNLKNFEIVEILAYVKHNFDQPESYTTIIITYYEINHSEN